MHHAAKKCAGGEDNRCRLDFTRSCYKARDFAPVQGQSSNPCNDNLDSHLARERCCHCRAVTFSVNL